MSFSSEVKNELVNNNNELRHCNIAEILSFLNLTVYAKTVMEDVYIVLNSDNRVSACRFYKLIHNTFSYTPHITICKNSKNNRYHYKVMIADQSVCLKILSSASLIDQKYGLQMKRINHLIIKRDCCKRAYLRGAFLVSGSLSDPAKSYHLEFVFNEKYYADEIAQMICYFGLNAKVILRKGHFVVYLKEGENIVDLLNIMGAHKSLMNLENIRILKDISNNVNRVVNFETANLSKTVNAAVKQVLDIEFIIKEKGGDYLDQPLKEVADIRLHYPNATLKEIGDLLKPQISKSGVNHRLRKISDIAEKLRREKYD